MRIETAGVWDIKSASLEESSRRTFDVVVAVIALILLGPLLLAVVLAIWFESGRPIFYSQVRLGRMGDPFRMYKFRKFHASCGASGLPLTLNKDERLTKVGRILRATKLDELPQFWNVLEGHMSIVGPRPESPAFADCFKGGFEKVLESKPGILGPSQVMFRNESLLYSYATDACDLYRRQIFPVKAQIDLDYYPNRTLRTDAIWVLRCALAVARVRVSTATKLTGSFSLVPDRLGSELGDDSGI